MDKKRAIDVLITAVEAATLGGAFKLHEAGLIAQAVAVLRTPDKAPAPVVDSPVTYDTARTPEETPA